MGMPGGVRTRDLRIGDEPPPAPRERTRIGEARVRRSNHLSYRLSGRGGQWGSNPQPSGPRPDAPPVELWPPCFCSGWAGGNDPPSPGGRVCPRGGASRPASPSLQPLFVQFIHLLDPRFPNANRPARQGARAGRRELAPCEAPAWLRASGAAPGTSRAAMFATESIACFLPHARLRHPPRPAANGVRMRLAPGAMGTRAACDTPRLRRGRVAGEVEEQGHGKLSSLFVSFAPDVRTQVPETKNRAADVPAELRNALHRRLPTRRNGGLEARVTSGRDSRGTQIVNGGSQVVNPLRYAERAQPSISRTCLENLL